MCCFSRPVKHVSATHIFARQMPGGRQAVVYSMNVEVREPLAMVLPLPVTEGAGDDAVDFIDLSGYPKFFRDLERAFPEITIGARSSGLLASARSMPRPKLTVHSVGEFVASFVPTIRDFDRLDERFRLSPEVFAERAELANHGFCVFQLAPRKSWFGAFRKQTVHPMAFTFPSRRPRGLFFPTLHVHDGHVPDRAWFDHSLSCQTDDAVLLATFPFAKSARPIGEHVDAARTSGLVDGSAPAYRNLMTHDHRNVDTWFEPPECAGPQVFRGVGNLFRFRLSATAAYYTELQHPYARRQHEVARTKLDAIHAALQGGLTALTTSHEAAWHLISPEGVTASTSLSNDEVFQFDSREPRPTKLDVGSERPIRLTLWTTLDAVEPQHVELAFARVPSPEVVKEIRRAIDGFVTEAIDR